MDKIEGMTFQLQVELFEKHNGNYFEMIKEAAALCGVKPPAHFNIKQTGLSKVYTLTEDEFRVNGTKATHDEKVLVFGWLTGNYIEGRENDG